MQLEAWTRRIEMHLPLRIQAAYHRVRETTRMPCIMHTLKVSTAWTTTRNKEKSNPRLIMLRDHLIPFACLRDSWRIDYLYFFSYEAYFFTLFSYNILRGKVFLSPFSFQELLSGNKTFV